MWTGSYLDSSPPGYCDYVDSVQLVGKNPATQVADKVQKTFDFFIYYVIMIL